MRLYHTTDAAEPILRSGFRDSEGFYGFARSKLRGVFLSAFPAGVNDGANGEHVLEVVFREDVELDEYAIVEAGLPQWEWCVPAKLINQRAAVRLLSQEEVDEIHIAGGLT